MKITIIADVPCWALGHLSQVIVKYNPHHSIDTLFAHPKELEREIIAGGKEIQEKIKLGIEAHDPTVIHFQYWRTAKLLLESMPELFKNRKIILTHHNQKNLLSANWQALGIDQHVCHTKKAKEILQKAGYKSVKIIQHGINLKEFTFTEKLNLTPTIGYCGRVVPWKGLKEIAIACYELGYKLLMMGKIDKPNYWESIPIEARNNIDVGFVNCTDDERVGFYRSLTCYVGNSSDMIEEGTLGFLEALACGIPVVSTPSGEAEDIYNGSNYRQVEFESPEELKMAIEECAKPNELTEQMRREGWESVKHMDERKMAREYSGLYFSVGSSKPLISVIIPTFNRLDNILKILEALKQQNWPLDIIIADDGSTDGTGEAIKKLQSFGIKYIYTGNESDDYGLARARNEAIIEAEGEFILFLDSRLLPSQDCIAQFMRGAWNDYRDTWFFGEKGGNKQTFVENFSFVRRDLLIGKGMFCERINKYGGMSQEIRHRFNDVTFVYMPTAKCVQMISSKLTPEKRQDIIDMKLRLWKMDTISALKR